MTEVDKCRIQKVDHRRHEIRGFLFEKVLRDFKIEIIARIVGKKSSLEFDASQMINEIFTTASFFIENLQSDVEQLVLPEK